MNQIFWTETHSAGVTHYSADYSTNDGWTFAEQDSFEIRWYPLEATPELVAKATKLLLTNTSSADMPDGYAAHTVPIVVKGGNSSSTITNKDWGFEVLYGVTRGVALKRLSVKKNEALSRQVHLEKDELYLVDEGHGQLELGIRGEVIHYLSKGDVVHVPPGVVHRLVAAEDGIVIIEASTPEITDIVRLADRYGRAVNDNFNPIAYAKTLR